ncbi:LIC20153 family lipoprotein [Leptospira koniambonensis]|uniref:LIC20153 family lipoprotein n=1 Tax=Leptospira koniambonensis TaxID=2484950 RepID=UPI001FC99A28|nr:hypothetical protein [Leptospira koniambonensis]
MLLLSASFVDCKKEDDGLNDLAVLSALSGGGDCVVDFPGKAAVTVNRTRVTSGASGVEVIWGTIPFVNHPIAIVETLGVQGGDTIVFHGLDVIDNPNYSGTQPTIYEASDCPLAESDLFDNNTTVKFNVSGSDPYNYQNTVAGSYYFLLYIVGAGTPPTVTVDFQN